MPWVPSGDRAGGTGPSLPSVTRRELRPRPPTALRPASLIAAVLLTVLVTGGGAAAEAAALPAPPPPVPALLADLDPTPRPLTGVRQSTACVTPAAGGEALVPATPWAQQRLRFTDAWAFTQGAGQTVAVIDTGVAAHPRLAGRLVDGGDFVGTGGALSDCDGHGTLVAGIIAAAPDPRTGFVGVAPDARVLSIRQSSATVSTSRGEGGGNVLTLAEAVVHAVTLGADVVNISEAACVPAADAGRVLAPLRAAVRFAVDSDVVVVAAAGNAGSGSCVQSTAAEGGQVVAPAWFSDDVLSVGYSGRDGQPAEPSVRGPWVSLSAPGTEIVSLSPTGAGLVDRVVPPGSAAPVAVEGTSFSAPYVSGVVALVRARHPELTPRQVMDRVRSTATHPVGPTGRDDAVGAGTVDPVAAVADVRPVEFEGGGAGRAGADASAGRVDLRAGGDADSGARVVALIGSAGVLTLAAAFAAILVVRRGPRVR